MEPTEGGVFIQDFALGSMIEKVKDRHYVYEYVRIKGKPIVKYAAHSKRL